MLVVPIDEDGVLTGPDAPYFELVKSPLPPNASPNDQGCQLVQDQDYAQGFS